MFLNTKSNPDRFSRPFGERSGWGLAVQQEDGIALVLALLVVCVIAITVASAIAYSTSASQAAAHNDAAVTATALAEAGVNYAAAILANPANDPSNPATLPGAGAPGSVTLGSGTASYWGSYDSSSGTWIVTGTGTVRNPTATQSVKHSVSEQFSVRQGGSSAGAWLNLFAASPGGCMTIPNSTVINQPLYVNGNLCLTGSGKITSSASTVDVVGTIQTSSSSTTVGTSASPIPSLHIGGGCRLGGSGSFSIPCTSAQYVYTFAQDTTVPTITKPALALAFWYDNAKPGPKASCTSGAFPGGFDNDSTLNSSRPTVDLMPSSPYDCTVISGGSIVGRIAWTPGSPGSLAIDGTIFFDGNISEGGNAKGIYSGRGTIYASGTISLGNSAQLCAAYASGTCDWTNWNPNTNMLVLVAGSNAATDFTTTGNARFQGGMYANTNYTQGNSVIQQGPVIANNIALSGAAIAAPVGGVVPAGAPGGSYTVAVVPGSWRG